MQDFASHGLWPFPDDIFNFFVGELLKNNWGKTGGVLVSKRMLTWFSLIWSQFQFLVTIDYFLGKKHIESMLYASTQPEGELLSDRYGTRTSQHIHVRSDNECWNIPYPLHCTKSQLSSAVLVRWPIRSLQTHTNCAGALFTIQNLTCTWCFARLYNSRDRWTIIAESKLWCIFKFVSIPCLVFYSQ